MIGARLPLALGDGLPGVPSGASVLVMRPRGGDDLSALADFRVTVVTGFRPDHDAFAAQGFTVAPAIPAGEFAAAVVCLPRARDLARAMLSEVMDRLPAGAPILVDGQKTDGVESMHKELRDLGLNPGPANSKAHGKIFALPAAPAPAGWAAQDQKLEGFVTRPGVFSADGVDRGSALLAAALPGRLPQRVIDLGAGWGYLSRAILARENVQEVHLVEAEAISLDCARRNVGDDPRAQFHWADALRFKPEIQVGAVVCNPPFHTGRAAEPALGMDFIRAAAGMLTTSGTLWLVANRHLPYQPLLESLFKEVEEIGGDSAFRLWRASRPGQKRVG